MICDLPRGSWGHDPQAKNHWGKAILYQRNSLPKLLFTKEKVWMAAPPARSVHSVRDDHRHLARKKSATMM